MTVSGGQGRSTQLAPAWPAWVPCALPACELTAARHFLPRGSPWNMPRSGFTRVRTWGGGAGGRGGAGQGGGEAEVEQRGQTVGSKYVQSREMASGQGREPGLARFGSPLDRSQVAGLSKAGGCQEVQPRGKAGCCHRAMPDGQGRQAQQQAGVAAGQRAAGQRAAGRQAAAEQGPSRWATCTRPLPRATARSSCLPRPHNRPAPGADWWPRSAPPQTRRRRRWLRHEGG